MAIYGKRGGGGGSSGVATVTAQTSNAINNADVANPVLKDATSSNAGTLSAADKTILDALPSAWITVGPTVGDSQDLTLATGLDGDADGGYEIKGYPAAFSGAETLYLRPNGVDTDCKSTALVKIPGNAGGTIFGVVGSYLFVGAGSPGEAITFRLTLDGDTAAARMYECATVQPADPDITMTYGQMAITGANITSLVIHGTSASSIKAGSIFKWRKLRIK